MTGTCPYDGYAPQAASAASTRTSMSSTGGMVNG
jgi:hypothetical protein